MDDKRLKLAKEALESGSYDKETIEYIFPELKASEDEKIRKEIIDYLKGFIPHHDDDLVVKSKVWIAWLENQGGQNKQQLYNIIIALWDLLDKIDTFSDLQIDDTNPDNPFRKIEDITQERHKFVKSDGYNLFIGNFMITNDKNFEKQGEKKLKIIDKSKKQWKPSEEQIEAFEHFVRSIGESGYASPYDNNTKLIYSLLNDLKNIRHER